MAESMRELGDAYAAEADNLGRMITACQERKRLALRGGKDGDATRQQRLIDLHTQQRADLLRLAAFLRHYYAGRDD